MLVLQNIRADLKGPGASEEPHQQEFSTKQHQSIGLQGWSKGWSKDAKYIQIEAC